MLRTCDCKEARKARLVARLQIRILAALALYAGAHLSPVYAQQPVGAARIVVNQVTGTLPAARERVLLRVNKDVFENEVIDSEPNSATLVVFRDTTQLAVCPSTEVVLRRVVLDLDPTRSEFIVFIPSGCTRFTSGLLLKAASFSTPSAEIRTYGTTATITVSGRGGTTVSVAEGAASVTGAGQTVTVAAGQSTLVLRGAPPTLPKATPPQPPIVAEMNTLLIAAAPDYGTRAAARSPEVEAPHGANMFSPNIDGKSQSEIAEDATPAFGCAGAAGTLGSRGTHGECASRGTHGTAGSRGTH